MMNLIRHIEKRVVRTYEFINNVLFYWQRGHSFTDAVSLAHLVMPEKR